MTKRGKKFPGSLLLFVGLTLLYSVWITGSTFRFQEVEIFPNYGMLAEAFAEGRLYITQDVPVDIASIHGKKYFYFGPVPALLRVPFWALFGIRIPTGLMIALFCAGIGTLFSLLISDLSSASESRLAGPARIVFVVAFLFNGYMWFMAMVPSIHHEAVCAEVFFLMIAVYYVIKVVRNSFAMTLNQALIIGVSLSLALGSRLIALVAAIFLVVLLLIGTHLSGPILLQKRRWLLSGILVGIPILAVMAMMVYNYARFGSFIEMGHKYHSSLYSHYILQGYALRYDHIPYNLWDYFCRLPAARAAGLGFDMQPFIWEVHSKLGPQYYLLHYNELSVSVFWMMPVLLFSLLPLSHRLTMGSGIQVKSYWILFGVFALQTLCVSLFLGSAARYAFDFLPFLMAMSFIGVTMLKSEDRSILILVVFTAALSVILSGTLIVNAFSSYLPYIRYATPWLR